jgi:hypothetical protein
MIKSLIFRAIDIIKEDGFIALLSWTWYYYTTGLALRAKIFNSKNSADTFRNIYLHNYWGSSETVSGTGSEKNQTSLIKEHLPLLLEKYQCKTILDAPCGDYQWMKTIVDEGSFFYIGADIVSGDFRRIDLFSPPYCLPTSVMDRFFDSVSPEPAREMCLFTRDDIRSSILSKVR